MSRYVGAIDQGTTSSRFIVFDREGSIIALRPGGARADLSGPGHVEHDPMEIWRKTQAVMREALDKGGLRPRPRGDRHHQPARDHADLGPAHR